MSKGMEEEFIWSHEKTCRLIFLLENSPCLYNTRLVEYKDRNKRNQAFAEIARKLYITVPEVVKKIRGLRSQYAREKHKEPLPNIPVESVQCKSKWVYYHLLHFLDEFTTVKRNQQLQGPKMSECYQEHENEDTLYPVAMHESIQENNVSFEDTTIGIDSDNFDQQSEFVALNNTVSEDATQTSYQQNSFPRSKKQKRDHTSENSVLEKTLSFLEGISSSRLQTDWEMDGDIIFGKYVASELRDIKDVQVKRTLKNKIQNLIYEAHCQQSEKL
ncbi:hypothetical protein HOLleu_30817 [Holothuria leucospilota]|uniref:MADF domain-containing protein n=1 Tax=Holothuria leucospilota TaxID=206669 RepID=A0A9Q1BKV2_HOLLE|nr:hypothetical protein HOLleu_30817 [Holothuria leucospilota]